jgi:hypothetical protein
MQAALIPVAYTIGTDFRPAARHRLATMVHWDQWEDGSAATNAFLPTSEPPPRGGRECDTLPPSLARRGP